MGCTQSKERPKDEPVNENVSPVRDETLRQQAPANEEVSQSKDGEEEHTHTQPFVQGGPSVRGGLITPCFKSGVLFKVCKDDVMYFYNDSAEHEAIVTFECGPQSTIIPSSNVVSSREGSWTKLVLTVYPGETNEFVSGTLNGYRSEYVVKPLSASYIARINIEADALVRGEIQRVKDMGLPDVNSIAEECTRSGTLFVDIDFPPCHSSLSRANDVRQLHPLVWKRPRMFLAEGKSPSLFKDGVHPDDIDQGQLGDCWFLCSVASVAEFPEKIKDIFAHPAGEECAAAERAVGIYRLTLNKHGWWHSVVVDDYLPCIINKPCFAKNDVDISELWVSLLEKAYAKINGSYAAITGGDALHAMSDLTGYPTTRFDTEWEAARKTSADSDALFSDLLRYDKEGYLINLNTPGVDTNAYMGPASTSNDRDFEAKYTAAGLGLGHAYSVLVVKEFVVDRVSTQLLKIRNPWGSGAEWTGRWSDKSELWQQHPTVAAACEHKDENDGTFWMEWDDVKAYFDGGGVCFTKFNWHDYRVRGQFAHGHPDIVLEVYAHESFDAFMVLSQPDRRGQQEASVNAKYSAMMLSVCAADPANTVRQLVDVNSTSDADKPTKPFTYIIARDVGIKYHFAKRDEPYVIIPRIHDKTVTKDFVMGFISSLPVGSAVTVNFKELDPASPGLKHFKAFPYMASDVQHASPRDFQYNAEVGCPQTLHGCALRTPAD